MTLTVVVGASGGVYCIFGVHVANFILNFNEMRKSFVDFRVKLLLLVLLFLLLLLYGLQENLLLRPKTSI